MRACTQRDEAISGRVPLAVPLRLVAAPQGYRYDKLLKLSTAGP